MKQLSTILSVVAIVLSGVALYKQFSAPRQLSAVTGVKDSSVNSGTNFKMAYFDIDSLQNNYQYFKDALAQLKVKEDNMNTELATLERSYQKKIDDWKKKGSSMSQSEAEAVQKEYQEMQQNFQQRKLSLEQQLQTVQIDYKKDIKKKIEDYLKDYNKDKNFSYILSYEPELFFYKDSAYDITSDLIAGLNALYKKK
jgi:outer membrane protein